MLQGRFKHPRNLEGADVESRRGGGVQSRFLNMILDPLVQIEDLSAKRNLVKIYNEARMLLV